MTEYQKDFRLRQATAEALKRAEFEAQRGKNVDNLPDTNLEDDPIEDLDRLARRRGLIHRNYSPTNDEKEHLLLGIGVFKLGPNGERISDIGSGSDFDGDETCGSEDDAFSWGQTLVEERKEELHVSQQEAQAMMMNFLATFTAM